MGDGVVVTRSVGPHGSFTDNPLPYCLVSSLLVHYWSLTQHGSEGVGGGRGYVTQVGPWSAFLASWLFNEYALSGSRYSDSYCYYDSFYKVGTTFIIIPSSRY